jgi:hypothetical protein
MRLSLGTSPSATLHRLLSLLQEHGFRLLDVPADGKCGLHALAAFVAERAGPSHSQGCSCSRLCHSGFISQLDRSGTTGLKGLLQKLQQRYSGLAAQLLTDQGVRGECVAIVTAAGTEVLDDNMPAQTLADLLQKHAKQLGGRCYASTEDIAQAAAAAGLRTGSVESMSAQQLLHNLERSHAAVARQAQQGLLLVCLPHAHITLSRFSEEAGSMQDKVALNHYMIVVPPAGESCVLSSLLTQADPQDAFELRMVLIDYTD